MRSGSKIMYSKITTGPVVEPVSLEEVKTDLKIDGSEEDALLTILIQASREDIEEKTSRSLITQTREIKLDVFPCTDSIQITHGPVQTITEVNYYDSSDELQVLAPSDYWVDTHSDVARIVIKNTWPSTKLRPNAVTIEYVAGYGDEAGDVPASLRGAVLQGTAWLYENRDQAIPYDLVMGLIGPYVVNTDVSY